MSTGLKTMRQIHTKPWCLGHTEPTVSDYDIGYDLYMQGRGPQACENDEQERGYYDANRGQSYAETVAYLIEEDDYSIEDDYTWIASHC